MPQEKVLVTGETSDEDVNTQITYNDIDNTGSNVQIQGVDLAPGQSVDLAEVLPKQQAQALARRLRKNPYFSVAGSEEEAVDMRKLEEARRQQSDKARQEGQRLQQERAQQAWEAQNPSQRGAQASQRQNVDGASMQAEEPPPGLGQESMRLETEPSEQPSRGGRGRR